MLIDSVLPSEGVQDGPGRPLQDVLKLHCFGCGALNERGLQIKSHWDRDELVCRWRPQPHHIGYPGIVYGGIIASVIDCHAIWTAMATRCRKTGHLLEDGPPPFSFVTGRLTVSYIKPVSIDHDMELRACVTEDSERKSLVICQVSQQGQECVQAEVLTIRVNPLN